MLPENVRFRNFVYQIVAIFNGFRRDFKSTFGRVICNDYDFSRSRSGLSTTEFSALDPDHLGELCSPGVQNLRGFLEIVILMRFIPKKKQKHLRQDFFSMVLGQT